MYNLKLFIDQTKFSKLCGAICSCGHKCLRDHILDKNNHECCKTCYEPCKKYFSCGCELNMSLWSYQKLYADIKYEVHSNLLHLVEFYDDPVKFLVLTNILKEIFIEKDITFKYESLVRPNWCSTCLKLLTTLILKNSFSNIFSMDNNKQCIEYIQTLPYDVKQMLLCYLAINPENNFSYAIVYRYHLDQYNQWTRTEYKSVQKFTGEITYKYTHDNVQLELKKLIVRIKSKRGSSFFSRKGLEIFILSKERINYPPYSFKLSNITCHNLGNCQDLDLLCKPDYYLDVREIVRDSQKLYVEDLAIEH